MTALSRPARRGAPPPRVFTSSCGLGTALAAFIGGGLLLSGCLVPQEVDPISNRKHFPPRIMVENIQPHLVGPYLTLVRAARDVGCRCELALAIPPVVEDDPTVDLEGRWFVDYDLRAPASQRPVARQTVKGEFDFTKTVRTWPTFSFDADSLGLTADGFHAVEVVVAESSGFNDGSQTTLPGRTLLEGYGATTYRFFVRIVNDPDAQQCPTEKPSTRICAGGIRP